jgi:hypothetical protein
MVFRSWSRSEVATRRRTSATSRQATRRRRRSSGLATCATCPRSAPRLPARSSASRSSCSAPSR